MTGFRANLLSIAVLIAATLLVVEDIEAKGGRTLVIPLQFEHGNQFHP